MLEFDDGAPTHLEFAIPALKSRGMPGTFYINPGNGPFRNHRSSWAREASSPGIEVANHTFSHIGGATVEEFDREIALANDVIDQLYPHRPRRRLRTWARPGVPKEQWGIGEADIQAVLAKYHMVERPPFFGPPFSIKTIPEMHEWVDGAVAAGELRHLVFHGVGGDWHSAPLPYFFALLEKLESLSGELWLTHPLTAHQYEVVRDSAVVIPLGSTRASLRFRIATDCDTTLYDQPISFAVRVPRQWEQAAVVQDERRKIVPVQRGELVFDAIPGGGEVLISG